MLTRRIGLAWPAHELVRLHDLRQFAGTQTARVGTLSETTAHLGHSTVAASLRYQHMVSGREAQIAAALSELAGGNRSH